MNSIFLPTSRPPTEVAVMRALAPRMTPSTSDSHAAQDSPWPLAETRVNAIELQVYWRRRQVEAVTGLKTATLYRYMKLGLFPRPHKLGPHTVGWTSASIQEWCNSRDVV